MNSSDYAGYQVWKEWSTKPFGAYSREHAVYFAKELRHSGIDAVDGKTILEIGFGNGEFAAWARDSGALYFGTELLDELVALGASAGFNTHSSLLPLDQLLGEQAVDLIVAFDVFEHLKTEMLRATLRSAHKALRPRGRLVFRVPSGDSPFSRAIQHGDATHRITLGSSMVRQLAKEADFTVEGIREPALPLRGLGLLVLLRRAAVVGLRSVVFPVVANAFMGGGRPVLTPNMVCVLVRG